MYWKTERLWTKEPLGIWRGGREVFGNHREPLSRVYRRLAGSTWGLGSQDNQGGAAQVREAVVVEVVVVVVVVVDVVVAVGDRDLWLVPRSLADSDDVDDDCVAVNGVQCQVDPRKELHCQDFLSRDVLRHQEVFPLPQRPRLPLHSCRVTGSVLSFCACNKNNKSAFSIYYDKKFFSKLLILNKRVFQRA